MRKKAKTKYTLQIASPILWVLFFLSLSLSAYRLDYQDVLEGNNGKDFIFGGSGADFISGGKGSDQINGGSGNDLVNGNGGVDTIFGCDDTLLSKGKDLIVGCNEEWLGWQPSNNNNDDGDDY